MAVTCCNPGRFVQVPMPLLIVMDSQGVRHCPWMWPLLTSPSAGLRLSNLQNATWKEWFTPGIPATAISKQAVEEFGKSDRFMSADTCPWLVNKDEVTPTHRSHASSSTFCQIWGKLIQAKPFLWLLNGAWSKAWLWGDRNKINCTLFLIKNIKTPAPFAAIENFVLS